MAELIGAAFLAASQLREAVEDLSAADINRLAMSDYAKIREAAGLDPIDPFSEVYSAPPGRPRQEPQAVQNVPEPPAPGPAGTDFSQLSMSEYKAIRDQYIRPSSGTGRGLFD